MGLLMVRIGSIFPSQDYSLKLFKNPKVKLELKPFSVI